MSATKSSRKPWTIAVLVIVAIVIAIVVIALRIPDPDISPALAQRKPDVQHGQYVAVLGDCQACHTRPGGAPLAGGVAFSTPIGTIYSTNITPDRATGIGGYSFPDFVRAMRLGVRPDGTRLYPAMPYTAYTKMSDEDLQDLFAYLQQGPAPVTLTNRPNPIAWPWNMRWPLAFWNIAFLDSRRFTPDPSHDARWNRGAYLVEGAAHCGECHTPREQTQNLDSSKKFAGTVVQGWKAYNITSSKTSGIGGWSDDALAAYLATGHADGHSSAAGPMAEEIGNSLHLFTHDDILAVVSYLRSIPAIENEPAVAANPPAATAETPPTGLGAQVFSGSCANCHDWDGKGAQSPYAGLLGSRSVNDPNATNMLQVLLNGSSAQLPLQRAFMPTFARGHTDDEIAAVANFVSGYFGNGTAHLTAADVQAARKGMQQTQ